MLTTARERRRVDAHLAAIHRTADCATACDDTVLLPRVVAYGSAPLVERDERPMVTRLPWLALVVTLALLALALTVALGGRVGDRLTPELDPRTVAQLDTTEPAPEPVPHPVPATREIAPPAEQPTTAPALVAPPVAARAVAPIAQAPAQPVTPAPVLVPPVTEPVDPNLTDPTLGDTGGESVGSSRCDDPLEIVVQRADGTIECAPEGHEQ